MKTKRVTALAALLLALITMIGSVPFPCSAAVYGDLSGDGAVSIADVTALLAALAADTADTDLDFDGVCSIKDVSTLLLHLTDEAPYLRCASGSVGVWWWNAGLAVNDTERETYLTFLAKNGVDEIYFCPGNYSNSLVASFVRDARRHGMRVAWLTGDCSWILPGNDGAQIVLDRFNAYQQSVSEDARFYGLHLDVEPHQLSDFRNDRPGYIQGFAELIVRTSAAAKQAGWEIEWDLPFWFDSDTAVIDGEEKALLRIAAESADTLTLMSYRDTAAAILNVSKEEIAAAKQGGCRIVCGCETHSSEGDSVSFMEEGKGEMVRQLADASALLAGTGLDEYGVAVHYLNTWYELKN